MTRPLLSLVIAFLMVPIGSQICDADDPTREGASLPELRYVDRQALPNFAIGGQPARIHTQGLFVTERYYYVTGRLQRNPKRPVLVRFDRANLSAVEHVDLLVASGDTNPDDAACDHPGGFDFDGESFWIPLAISRPNSRSLIVKFHGAPGQPLTSAKAKVAFRVDDHIGAIACDIKTGRLYGANWDAKQIYVWEQDGTLIERSAQIDLLPRNLDRAFAVQDWKGIGGQRVLAGASDKSSRRHPHDSKAVLQLIDLGTKHEEGLIRVASPPDRNVIPTNEGMALFRDHVYFLPADLGTNAEVFYYRWSMAPRWAK